MPLTDAAIRNAKPGVTPKGATTEKPYKLGDAGGLYVEVRPDGGKYWRLKYRHGGKEKRLSLGVYPDVPLAKARQKRDDARKLWREASLKDPKNDTLKNTLGRLRVRL